LVYSGWLDIFVAEDIGINKYDILSQRGLGHIKDALQLIKENKGIEVNIHDFKNFRTDPDICRQIREANTIGCFYIESPAMNGYCMASMELKIAWSLMGWV